MAQHRDVAHTEPGERGRERDRAQSKTAIVRPVLDSFARQTAAAHEADAE